jgi:citronellol/citronellal dehydrogenase
MEDDSNDTAPEGAVAVVTGATRGLGLAIARHLARRGYRVVAVGRSTDAAPHRLLAGTLEGVAAQLASTGTPALAVRADLADPADVDSIVDRTLDWAGRCDVLVNNASYTPAGTFADVPVSRWSVGMAITVLAPVRLAQGFLPGMVGRGSGRILNIGSEAAAYATSPDSEREYDTRGTPLLYGVTKAALERFTDGLHQEYHRHGIAVNNLRAGQMATEGWHLMRDATGFDTPVQSVHTPDEAAAAACWMIGQPLTFSGHIVDFGDLVRRGVLPDRTGVSRSSG